MNKYLFPEPSIKQIITLYDVIGKFSDENCQRLHPLVAQPNDYPDFYFGMLRRIRGFAFDIKAMLENSHNNYPSTILIIARCICDDLLSIYHIEHSEDREEEVIKNTADAFRQEFDKIEYLKYLNVTFYDSKFPFYPTEETIIDVKTKFLSRKTKYVLNPENTDITQIKFKSYPNYRNLVEALMKKASKPEDIGRVYFWWRELSSHVHFSTYSMNSENELMQSGGLLNRYQEFASFMFLSLRKIMAFFVIKHQYEPVDNYQLFAK